MRTLAIGDIHGCLTALKTLADFVPFKDDDHLITLGDYVDRGPNSNGVIEWLIHRESSSQLTVLRGNHEVMMLAGRHDERAREQWLYVGGQEALQSYDHLGDGGSIADVPDAHWDFMERTKPYFENDLNIFVHANLYPDTHLDEQPDNVLYWEGFNWNTRHFSGKVMICGHSSQRSGLPLVFDDSLCIDTRVYGADGWLTCLNPETGQYWQANERGETRGGRVDELR